MAFLRGKGYKNQKMCVQLYCKVLGDKINFEIGLYKLYQRSIDQVTWHTLHGWH